MTALGALAGVRVVVTRPRTEEGASDRLAAALEDAGATAIAIPLTRIEPLDPAPLRSAVAARAPFDVVCFTSANAVPAALEAARAAGRDLRTLATRRVVAVGTATAEALARAGVRDALVPARFSQEGVLEAVAAEWPGGLAGARVLHPAAEGVRPLLAEGLRAMGAEVEVVPVYRTVPDLAEADVLRRRIAAGDVDVVALLAPSAVAALVEAVGDDARRVPVATIGPVTGDAARAAGLRVVAEAEPSTTDGLVAALSRWAAGARG